MTNMEYYREQIEAILGKSDESIAMLEETGELVKCDGLPCNMCAFATAFRGCKHNLIRWLMAEHKEEPTLTPDEAALLRLLKDGYIARDADGALCWFSSKPYKPQGCRGWEADIGTYACLTVGFSRVLDFIRGGDEEPWSVEDLRKLRVKKEAQPDAG